MIFLSVNKKRNKGSAKADIINKFWNPWDPKLGKTTRSNIVAEFIKTYPGIEQKSILINMKVLITGATGFIGALSNYASKSYFLMKVSRDYREWNTNLIVQTKGDS